LCIIVLIKKIANEFGTNINGFVTSRVSTSNDGGMEELHDTPHDVLDGVNLSY